MLLSEQKLILILTRISVFFKQPESEIGIDGFDCSVKIIKL